MNRTIKVSILLLVCSFIAAVPSSWAEWIEDGALICSTDYSELSSPEIASDGSGGAIIVFIRELFDLAWHWWNDSMQR